MWSTWTPGARNKLFQLFTSIQVESTWSLLLFFSRSGPAARGLPNLASLVQTPPHTAFFPPPLPLPPPPPPPPHRPHEPHRPVDHPAAGSHVAEQHGDGSPIDDHHVDGSPVDASSTTSTTPPSTAATSTSTTLTAAPSTIPPSTRRAP